MALTRIKTDQILDGTITGSDIASGTDISSNNLTLSGDLRGPATFTIDPAAIGDNTGTVVIAGDLQVDGETTTINSSTLTVDDKQIVIASGATDNTSADGAGILIDGADAEITYDGTNDRFEINKDVSVSGDLNVDSGTLFVDSANNRVGVGTSSPDEALHVEGNIEADRIQLYSDGSSVNGRYYGGLSYTGTDQLITFNSKKSTSLFVIGDGVKHKTAADGYVSTANNVNHDRGVFEVGSELRFATRDNIDAPIGTDVDLNTRFFIDNNGDISFYEDTGTTPKFFWDASAEMLGIGTSSPLRPLEVDNGAIIRGESDFFRNESPVIHVERGDRGTNFVNGDRGHFISARSDNSLGLQDNFIAFNIHDGTNTDSTIKSLQITGTGDIIVDGGVYLGGTGSANYLDDYEEGTYTVSIFGSNGNATISNNGTLSYTKVGDTVHVRGFIQGIDATGVGDNVKVTLPFAIGQSGNTDRLTGSIFILNAAKPPRDYIIYPESNKSIFKIQDATNSAFDQIDESDLGASSFINIGLSLTFKTNA